jgi:hypothetical protein
MKKGIALGVLQQPVNERRGRRFANALRADRAFEGVCIELDDQGTVTVHAIGMTSILL